MNHPNDKRNWRLTSDNGQSRTYTTDPYVNIYGNTVVSTIEKNLLNSEWLVVGNSVTKLN